MRVPATKASDGQFVTSWGAVSHFNISEFMCHCGVCEFDEVDQSLVDLLESMRIQLGLPMMVASGIRCAQHNRNIKGATRSQHLPDNNGISGAADLVAQGVSSSELFMLAIIYQAPGRGIGPTRVHVDTRTESASWMYGDFKGQKPETWIVSQMERGFKGGNHDG